MLLTEIGPAENKLEFLEEYLIVVPTITLREAKSLIKMIREDYDANMAAVQKEAMVKRNWIQKKYDKMVEAAKGLPAKLKAAKEWFKAQMAKLGAWVKKAKEVVKNAAKKSGGVVKTKYQAGVKLAKSYPKTAVGLAAAAVAAGAGGGYLAYKKRKEGKK